MSEQRWEIVRCRKCDVECLAADTAGTPHASDCPDKTFSVERIPVVPEAEATRYREALEEVKRADERYWRGEFSATVVASIASRVARRALDESEET